MNVDKEFALQLISPDSAVNGQTYRIADCEIKARVVDKRGLGGCVTITPGDILVCAGKTKRKFKPELIKDLSPMLFAVLDDPTCSFFIPKSSNLIWI